MKCHTGKMAILEPTVIDLHNENLIVCIQFMMVHHISISGYYPTSLTMFMVCILLVGQIWDG